MNWGRAKAQAKRIVANNGATLQWLVRSTSLTSAFDTGSSVTFGYGDPIVTWATGSFKGIIIPKRDMHITIEPGTFIDDYRQFWVDPDEMPTINDQVIYPSGSGIRYLVRGHDEWSPADIDVSARVTIRKLSPNSGSVY